MKPASRPTPHASTKHETDIETESASQSQTRWWVVLLGVGLVVLVASAALVLNRRLDGWELHVFRSINNWPESLYYPFVAATILPQSLWIAVISVIGAFLAKTYRLAWQLAASIFIGYAMTFALKHFIGRARPFDLVGDVHQRISESGMGFTSGHAMIITIIALSVWPYLPKGWRWLVLVLIPAMALSRVYLGVHSPLDVVGGVAVGVISVAIFRVLPARLRSVLQF